MQILTHSDHLTDSWSLNYIYLWLQVSGTNLIARNVLLLGKEDASVMSIGNASLFSFCSTQAFDAV